MKSPPVNNFLRNLLLGSSLVLIGTAALWAVHWGNMSSAAIPEHVISEPPTVVASAVPDAAGREELSDPLVGDAWNHAHWWTLSAPANTTRTTLPTRAAILYDSSTLYAAFVSEKAATPPSRDAVCVYLDSTATGQGAGEGTEFVRISVDSSGQAACTWLRISIPVEKRADAAPNMAQPVLTIPGVPIKGLEVKVSNATDRRAAVWTAVVAIPLKNLPSPLKTSAAPGMHWKINLLRNVTRTGEESEQLQANLSPVYVGAQDLTPYRMAELVLQ
jgi:hypothetical protein